ncbi:hypothetical protein [Polymorphospora sp. NPDC050346]|uniref:MGH1-like glycoside hydrolase domain-containing protein n=1 Tax=Polymorphospora sp. NPDC050346 TaxID=3155780 RepID=UPI0033F561AD
MNRLTAVSPAPHPLSEDDESLWRTATEVLDANWRTDHTVPSGTLYPHQWSWDSAFISIGLAHIAPDRAWRDLRSLFEAQWPDGRVPHIVFDLGVAERDYFPGPDFWDVPAMSGRPPRFSTGLVQPPAHALAAWEVYRRAPGDASAEELRRLYPRLVALQDYLIGARGVSGTGLASIVHPWESGLDNSPSWDMALANVTADEDLLIRYERQDLKRAAADHRPTNDDYARYIAIAATYRNGGYSDADLVDRHLFVVECPAYNSLLGAAEHALARIAAVVGADPAPHRDRAATITRSIVERLYDPESGTFRSLDLKTGRLSTQRCVNGLFPLILGDLPRDIVAQVVAEAESARFGINELMPIPSSDRTADSFDANRYWRGPVWINANWLLARGLAAHGYAGHAATLRTAMLDLVRRSGYYEYFHPITGDGIGAGAFSWTAALVLDMLAEVGPRIGDPGTTRMSRTR